MREGFTGRHIFALCFDIWADLLGADSALSRVETLLESIAATPDLATLEPTLYISVPRDCAVLDLEVTQPLPPGSLERLRALAADLQIWLTGSPEGLDGDGVETFLALTRRTASIVLGPKALQRKPVLGLAACLPKARAA